MTGLWPGFGSGLLPRFDEFVSMNFSKYRCFSLKTTISSQQIFQSLVRNKQFKFSRVFEIKTNLGELAEQLGNSKNARKFELLISDQRLEYLLRGNGRFETEIPVFSRELASEVTTSF